MQHTVRPMGDELNQKLDKMLGELRDDLAKLPAEPPEPSRIADARALLADENPDALWPDGLDDAFIGLAHRCGQPVLAAFSMKRCVEVLMKRDGMTFEEALEFLDFNTFDAWLGDGTPVWIADLDEGDLDED